MPLTHIFHPSNKHATSAFGSSCPQNNTSTPSLNEPQTTITPLPGTTTTIQYEIIVHFIFIHRFIKDAQMAHQTDIMDEGGE